MTRNPLFPDNDTPKPGFVLPEDGKTIQPLAAADKTDNGSSNTAADVIRDKLARLYATEPDPLAEEKETKAVPHRSPHQQFMYDLSTSGRSLADIQTAWHNYYVALPDDQKHQVWQEFYENNARRAQPELYQPAPRQAKTLITSHQPYHRPQAVVGDHTPVEQFTDPRPAKAIRSAILSKVAAGSDKIPAGVKQNIRSMLFGLATASIVLAIFLFSFFNQVIIAPFIQPSRASATPIIVNSESVDASEPKVIIPKINLEIPIVYDLADNSEATIQKGLENGVIHYPTTPRPGQKGNAAYFGHSSNNIFNKGKYKFAFVLLHKLEVGDTYYLTYNDTVYSYKVIDKKIVAPSQTEVLDSVPGQVATSTLITCDPPGTSLNRLVIVGQQISPDPASNSEAAPSEAVPAPSELTGNGPSLWSRMWNALF